MVRGEEIEVEEKYYTSKTLWETTDLSFYYLTPKFIYDFTGIGSASQQRRAEILSGESMANHSGEFPPMRLQDSPFSEPIRLSLRFPLDWPAVLEVRNRYTYSVTAQNMDPLYFYCRCLIDASHEEITFVQ